MAQTSAQRHNSRQDKIFASCKAAQEKVAQEKVSKVKLNTVNVIEFGEEPTDIKSLRSFTDDENGNEAAEELFKACVMENGGSGDGIEEDVEDGYWIAAGGGYTIVITHNT